MNYIKRLRILEDKEYKLILEFIRIVDNYQNKYNKNIFSNVNEQ